MTMGIFWIKVELKSIAGIMKFRIFPDAKILMGLNVHKLILYSLMLKWALKHFNLVRVYECISCSLENFPFVYYMDSGSSILHNMDKK